MTKGLDFIAIDFETATGKRASICEAGICVVKDGKVVETKSWLVRPEDNAYSYWNIQIHGIHPEDTENAPEFPEVWTEILEYLTDTPVLVAHNLLPPIILVLFFLSKRVSSKGLSPLTEDSLFVFEYLLPTSYTHK